MLLDYYQDISIEVLIRGSLVSQLGDDANEPNTKAKDDNERTNE